MQEFKFTESDPQRFHRILLFPANLTKDQRQKTLNAASMMVKHTPVTSQNKPVVARVST